MKYYGKPIELVPQMQKLISNNQGFWVAVTGKSMVPTLNHLKDRVFISPIDRKVKKGDILLTVTEGRKGKHCLLHRVIKCKGDMLYYRGDGKINREGPLPARDVIGIVTQIERNGKIVLANNFYYKLWHAFWRKIILLKHYIMVVFSKLK